MPEDSQTSKPPPGSTASGGSATGWWNPNPYNGRRRGCFHYVWSDRRSLCGRWAYIQGHIEEGQDAHVDNCAACRKRKLALNAKRIEQWADVLVTPNVRVSERPKSP